MKSKKQIKHLLLWMSVSVFGFACTTSNEVSPPPFQELSESYFNSGLLSAVSSEQITGPSEPQTIRLAKKSVVEKSAVSSTKLSALGVEHANSGCNCDTVKVCQGQDLPAAYEGAIAATSDIVPPRVGSDGENRFYHLRSCDVSPQELAFFIWGDRSRGQELVENVGGASKWTPGRLIQYKSPRNTNPGLQSFYSDHPGTTKTYRVQPGDNLASIAVKVYGDQRSWKELAVENNIRHPDHLKVGQLLQLNYKE